MRRSLTGTTAMRVCPRSALPGARRRVSRWLPLFFLAGLLAPGDLRAQNQPAPSAATTQAAGPNAAPLSRFVPKDNLICYLEFAGVDARSEAWKNTAAYKMLNETPLGEMLGEVAGQLLDKVLTFYPNHKTSGSEIVTLAKNAARSGWVLAINANPKGPDLARGTLVLRGAARKELRPLASRFMGLLMATAAKPKIENKEGRTLIVVPAAGAQGSKNAVDPGWVWWAEKDDLVVGFMYPTSADAIIATLDGKSPSATEHPQVQDLAKPEGKFQPVCIGFAETANCPDMANGTSAYLRNLNTEWGIQRIDFRWGFDAEALMAVTRLVAPKPRKPALAFVDQTAFEKSSMMAMPDGVESFVTMSISPSQLLETIKQIAPENVKDQIDEMTESVRNAGQIDLQKDILAYMGPRMIAYLAPGQSAATNDDSLEAALSKGWSPTAAVTALQSVFPKLTLVAEVNKPEAFSKGMDALIIAVNGELKAQAMEKAREEQAAAEKGTAGAAGGNQGGRRMPQGGGGDRTKRRRSLRDTPAPRFTLMPTPGKVKSFVLTTPTDSHLRFGPSSFRPTIQLDGKYVAFGVSPDAARAALAAVQRKDWKPSTALLKAWETLPPKLAALVVADITDSLPSLLASLPGTLQTMINTSIALASGRAGKDQTAAGAGQPGGAMSGPAGLGSRSRSQAGASGGTPAVAGRGAASMPSGGPGGRGGPSRPGGAGSLGAGGGFGGAAGGSTPPATTAPGSTTPGSANDSMVVLKIDSDKLPKAPDLKAYLFPSTLCVVVSDQDVKVVSRGAFPNLSAPTNVAPIAGAIPGLSSLIDRLKPAQAGAASPAPGAGSPPGDAAAPKAATGSPAPGLLGGRRGGGRPAPR